MLLTNFVHKCKIIKYGMYMMYIRTFLHKKCMRIFEHNFVADKAKIRRYAVAWQGFLTQYAAKFAEKTCAYAYEERFLYAGIHYICSLSERMVRKQCRKQSAYLPAEETLPE